MSENHAIYNKPHTAPALFKLNVEDINLLRLLDGPIQVLAPPRCVAKHFCGKRGDEFALVDLNALKCYMPLSITLSWGLAGLFSMGASYIWLVDSFIWLREDDHYYDHHIGILDDLVKNVKGNGAHFGVDTIILVHGLLGHPSETFLSALSSPSLARISTYSMPNDHYAFAAGAYENSVLGTVTAAGAYGSKVVLQNLVYSYFSPQLTPIADALALGFGGALASYAGKTAIVPFCMAFAPLCVSVATVVTATIAFSYPHTQQDTLTTIQDQAQKAVNRLVASCQTEFHGELAIKACVQTAISPNHLALLEHWSLAELRGELRELRLTGLVSKTEETAASPFATQPYDMQTTNITEAQAHAEAVESTPC